jgi:hypothetical protein
MGVQGRKGNNRVRTEKAGKMGDGETGNGNESPLYEGIFAKGLEMEAKNREIIARKIWRFQNGKDSTVYVGRIQCA